MHKRGSPGSRGGFLKIAEAPPKLLEARQHGKTVLECSASGNPAPEITWYKDGQPLIKEVSINESMKHYLPIPLTLVAAQVACI